MGCEFPLCRRLLPRAANLNSTQQSHTEDEESEGPPRPGPARPPRCPLPACPEVPPELPSHPSDRERLQRQRSERLKPPQEHTTYPSLRLRRSTRARALRVHPLDGRPGADHSPTAAPPRARSGLGPAGPRSVLCRHGNRRRAANGSAPCGLSQWARPPPGSPRSPGQQRRRAPPLALRGVGGSGGAARGRDGTGVGGGKGGIAGLRPCGTDEL